MGLPLPDLIHPIQPAFIKDGHGDAFPSLLVCVHACTAKHPLRLLRVPVSAWMLGWRREGGVSDHPSGESGGGAPGTQAPVFLQCSVPESPPTLLWTELCLPSSCGEPTTQFDRFGDWLWEVIILRGGHNEVLALLKREQRSHGKADGPL